MTKVFRTEKGLLTFDESSGTLTLGHQIIESKVRLRCFLQPPQIPNEEFLDLKGAVLEPKKGLVAVFEDKKTKSIAYISAPIVSLEP